MNHSPSHEDVDLVRAARKDAEAFAFIIDRYWERLAAYVRRVFYFTPEDVEDIMQETFIKIYTYLNDYDERMTFSTWAYRIARNTAIDEVRRRSARVATTPMTPTDLAKLAHSSVALDEAYMTQETLDRIAALIETLPEKYRDVLVLRFVEEKNYEEMMDIMQLPKGTVASLVHRGRSQLLQALRETHADNLHDV